MAEMIFSDFLANLKIFATGMTCVKSAHLSAAIYFADINALFNLF